jgi:hypothetical protein
MALNWNNQFDDPRLNVVFKNDLQSVLGPDEDNWGVDDPCVRTPAEQDAEYAKGRTAPGGIVTQAKGNESPHVWGLAADIYRIVGVGIVAVRKWDYDQPAWARIRALIDAHPRLHGGWHFPAPGDPDHIEAQPAWNEQKASLVASGRWGSDTV